MQKPCDFSELSCQQCRNGESLGFDFSMAFQPIIDIQNRSVFAYEALVRGVKGESAYSILSQVNESNRYRFDQTCRVKAISLAAQLGIDCFVSINFLPNAVYKPELCIRTTLKAAKEYNFPVERILFELIEDERIVDMPHLKNIIEAYQQMGFLTALDDFGSVHSGLNLLANFHPDLLKLDIELIRDIDSNPVKQSIVKHMAALCSELKIRLLAEGVETEQEFAFLKQAGVVYMQGYYIARPGFEMLPAINPAVFDQPQ
ncbi:EAL domain-containing protein [Neptunicella marina]|uniref:EAL domain-containing protein n=1 Tax=Neptunicella marina TaxID=2125989 RepID=A0A8J6IVA4_9ALTE|nr:EAL domain-containing protein [Neptunicella marina]MBC3766485.1 EAL domain-containing protein [Neptunicella marina]